MFAVGVISVHGGCNKCSRGNMWNKQPATDQSDHSISLKYGISVVRLRSFGNLVLWISLRSPLDLLNRWNSHVYKQSAMGKLVFT